MKCVGVLALQGDYAAHAARLESFDIKVAEVRSISEIKEVDALVIPGGESTAMLRLMDESFRRDLAQIIADGLPIFATCAGLILIAQNVYGPEQESLKVLDVDVERNSYGRQIDSFKTNKLKWTNAAREVSSSQDSSLEGIFIRAPKIIRTGNNVEVMATLNDEPMLVKQGNIFAATFHPELSDNSRNIYQLFTSTINNA